MSREYLPAGPLIDAVQRAGGLPPFAARGELAQAFYRARRSGRLTIESADQLAVRLLAVHPYFVWHDDWWCADELVASDG
jgi:hypothetical protein